MNQHKRTEAINRLTEEIKTTTDPELLVKLSNSLSKLVKQGRRRKSVAKPVEKTPKKGYSHILDECAGSGIDNFCDGEKVLTHAVREIEKRIRTGQNQQVAIEEVKKSLSEREFAVLEAYAASQEGA